MSMMKRKITLPFGVRKRLHPLFIFGLTVLGATTLIVAGGLFVAESVTAVAGSVQLSETVRQEWYMPAQVPKYVARDLDIARDHMVSPLAEEARGAESSSVDTRTVGVESLRVRSDPSLGSRQIFALKGGTRVLLKQSKGKCVEIVTTDDRQGWVIATLLRVPNSSVTAGQQL